MTLAIDANYAAMPKPRPLERVLAFLDVEFIETRQFGQSSPDISLQIIP